MAFVDKGDFKTGLWIGLGVLAALLIWSWAQALVGKVRA
jgi:hypothetical protein